VRDVQRRRNQLLLRRRENGRQQIKEGCRGGVLSISRPSCSRVKAENEEAREKQSAFRKATRPSATHDSAHHNATVLAQRGVSAVLCNATSSSNNAQKNTKKESEHLGLSI